MFPFWNRDDETNSKNAMNTFYREIIEIQHLSSKGYHARHILNAAEIDAQDERFKLKDGVLFECEVTGNIYKVQINGDVNATIELSCDRCSLQFERKTGNKFCLTYLPVEYLPASREEARIYEKDLDVAYYSEGKIELHEILKEQIFLLVPIKNLCDEKCKGICSVCGCNLNEEQCDCQQTRDERWAPLKKLLDK